MDHLQAFVPLFISGKVVIDHILVLLHLEEKIASASDLSVSSFIADFSIYSPSKMNLLLKQLKKEGILTFDISPKDERFKIIRKGPSYDAYVTSIRQELDAAKKIRGIL